MLEMYLVHKHDLEIHNKSIWNLWAIHASKVKLYLVQNSFILLLSCNKWIHDIFGLGQNINRDTQSPLSVTIKASRLEFSQFWLHCWTWISECDLPLLGKYTSLKAVMSISVGCMDFWKSCLQFFYCNYSNVCFRQLRNAHGFLNVTSHWESFFSKRDISAASNFGFRQLRSFGCRHDQPQN